MQVESDYKTYKNFINKHPILAKKLGLKLDDVYKYFNELRKGPMKRYERPLQHEIFEYNYELNDPEL